MMTYLIVYCSCINKWKYDNVQDSTRNPKSITLALTCGDSPTIGKFGVIKQSLPKSGIIKLK